MFEIPQISDIDDCANVTCQYNGTCVDGISEYICTCVTGYTGEHCETSKLKEFGYSFYLPFRLSLQCTFLVAEIFSFAWFFFCKF